MSINFEKKIIRLRKMIKKENDLIKNHTEKVKNLKTALDELLKEENMTSVREISDKCAKKNISFKELLKEAADLVERKNAELSKSQDNKKDEKITVSESDTEIKNEENLPSADDTNQQNKTETNSENIDTNSKDESKIFVPGDDNEKLKVF